MMTVSIVNPKAPKKVKATMRCARVGFGRGGVVTSGFVSVGGVLTVGFGNSIGYDAHRDNARDHTLNTAEPTEGGAGLKSVEQAITVRIRAIIVLTALALAGEAAARDLQAVLNTGTLRIGVTLFAPWAARGADGELAGFEVDVARQLAADMGVKAQLLAYEVDRLVPALEAGEIDLIAAGLTITPERALHVNFSQPYAESGIALATHLARTANVTDIDALDSEEYTIAAVEGSVGLQLAQRLWPRARLQPFASVEAATEALLAGLVHGYVDDEPVPTFLALENPGVIDVPTTRPLLASRAGFAVGKGDPDFLAFLNAWITAREADTWLPTTASYWFKSLRWRERLGDATSRR
jgi:polar amino acid transport system substrate-binding protein